MSSIIKKPARPKQKHPHDQESRVIKIVIGLVLLALLWIIFAPGSGVVTLLNKKSELKKMQHEKAQIEGQIDALQKDIDRLHNDPAYLEDLARREYGLLKKNEKVFDFSKSQPDKNK